MLQILKNWLHKRRTPLPNAAPEKASTYAFNMPEQIHLHWHVNDITQIPAQFFWHSPSSVKFNALESALQPQPPSQSPAYDPHLLDNARTQWQFGDSLEAHPERAKLALLAAAGHQQVGNMNATRDFVQLARDWGCDKQLISRVLVAGVYNTLGKAAAVGGKQDKALGLFEQSVRVGMPGREGRLLIDARTTAQLGFSEGMKINSNETAQIVNNFGLSPISIIEPRNRREFDENFISETKASPHYRSLIGLLDYPALNQSNLTLRYPHKISIKNSLL